LQGKGFPFLQTAIMKVLKALYFSTIFLISSLTSFAQSPLQLDTTFRVDMNGQPYLGNLGDYWIEEDGSIIMVGSFEHKYYQDDYPRVCVKLDGLGKLDTQFQYQHPYSGTWATKIAHHNGMYYLGHYSHPGVNRIYPDGTIDTSFRFPMDSFWLGSVQVSDIHIRADGKVLVSGLFNINASGGYGLIQLNQDGSLDTTFYYSFVDKTQSYIFPLSDGKYLIGGVKFDIHNTRQSIWRIHPDGRLDSSFNCYSSQNNIKYIDTVPESGKILCCGSMLLPGSPYPLKLVRLEKNGSIDSSFNFLNHFDGIPGGIPASFLIEDNRIIVGGGYRYINGRKYNSLAVFDTLGNLDTLLSANLPGPDTLNPWYSHPWIFHLKRYGSKILANGGFSTFSGFPSFGLVRLHGLTAGLNEVEKSGSMHCFPNPVSGEVNIRVEQALSGTYRLLDMSGRLLYSGVLYPAQKHHRISLPTLAPGLYLLQLSSKDGKEYCEKLVVD